MPFNIISLKEQIQKTRNSLRNISHTKEFMLYVTAAFFSAALFAVLLYPDITEAKCVLHFLYFFLIFMILLLFVNPCSLMYRIRMDDSWQQRTAVVAAVVLVGALCAAPMGLNSTWRGDKEPRDQYEELADALLEGHLNVHDGEDTSALSAMENPYDKEQRVALDVPHHWDHVFYDGKYYVYFGVVPAIVLFIPYKLLAGEPLTTWKATAVFSVFIVLAFFCLGYRIARKIKSDIPLGVYLCLASALSLVTLWYAVKYPAMYCTAIVSGLCFFLWSLYFLLDAFYFDTEPRVWKTGLGALFGALVFGCRPPIGLAEIALLPLIVHFLRNQREKKIPWKKTAVHVAAFAAPYLVTAALLMLYNYARFGNPLEFGTSYQLTVADQRGYIGGGMADGIPLLDFLNAFGFYFLEYTKLAKAFPWVTAKMGTFVMFPLLLFAFGTWNVKEKDCLKWFHGLLLASIVAIVAMQMVSTPYPIPRYRMDFVFLLCLAVLFHVVYRYKGGGGMRVAYRYGVFVNLLALLAVFVSFLQFFTSMDLALVESDPDLAEGLIRFFTLQDAFE